MATRMTKVSPGNWKATYTADDTDNHDYIAGSQNMPSFGGKASADNPSDQSLTVDVYGAPSISSDVGDANVHQIGSFNAAATAGNYETFEDPYPYYIFRASQGSAGDSTTISLYLTISGHRA